MTGLLVSVRNPAEAIEALAGGADVIDVKEPHRGALGAADPHIWQLVRQALPNEFPLSVALGELSDAGIGDRAAAASEVQYAKVGLAGGLAMRDWQRRWDDVLSKLPPETKRVAVGYADHRAAGAPSLDDVLSAAPAAGCGTLLLDTFAKNQGDLFAHLHTDQLAEFTQQCRDKGIALVLAGSLRLTSIQRALAFAPTLLAVRGAACRGDRTGTVCSALVKQLKERIRMRLEGDLISL